MATDTDPADPLAPLDPADLEVLPWPPAPAGGMFTGRIGPGCLVRHRPTGLSAIVTTERGQHQNKAIALRDLARMVAHGAPGGR